MIFSMQRGHGEPWRLVNGHHRLTELRLSGVARVPCWMTEPATGRVKGWLHLSQDGTMDSVSACTPGDTWGEEPPR